MSLAQANKNLKFDKRLTEIYLNVGEISKDDVKKHLEQLPDLAHNIETVSLENSDTTDALETH